MISLLKQPFVNLNVRIVCCEFPAAASRIVTNGVQEKVASKPAKTN
jgi:hypothetical protein